MWNVDRQFPESSGFRAGDRAGAGMSEPHGQSKRLSLGN
jgi:hypothetical protein